MKSPMLLPLAVVMIALVSWAFWHYLGSNAVQALTLVVLMSLATDNYRLRRRLKTFQSEK